MVKHGVLALHRGKALADRNDIAAVKKTIGTSGNTFVIIMGTHIGPVREILSKSIAATNKRVLEVLEP